MLCVGASYSSEDIGIQCYKYGAKTVTFSYRTRPMGFKWPESNFTERPLLEKLEGKTAFFKDGTTKEVDAIILCTGYLHHHPVHRGYAAPEVPQPPLSAEPLQGHFLVGQSAS